MGVRLRNRFVWAGLFFGGLLLGGAPRSARAESSDLNVHLELAYAQPILGPYTQREGDRQARKGMAGWASLDYVLGGMFAIEGIVGAGYLWETAELNNDPGSGYYTAAVGTRLRFMDDDRGYAFEPWGNWLGNLWVSAHIGYHGLEDVQFGVDAAVGYEFSVVRPVQLGVLARTVLAFGGNDPAVDGLFFFGIGGSYGLIGEEPPKDLDNDSLPDADEERLGLNPRRGDSDGDGIPDSVEVRTGTDPTHGDTDNDGLSDGREDRNADGRLDRGETDPRRADTDGGGITDLDEVMTAGQDPSDPRDDDLDGDGVANPYDTCPSTPKGVAVGPSGCAASASSFAFEKLQFDEGTARFAPGAEEELEKVLAVLRGNAGLRLEIGAHTNEAKTKAANRRLALRRAKAVRGWLQRRKIASKRLRRPRLRGSRAWAEACGGC